jgi:transposase
MSWIEVKPMDAKVLFIADWIRDQHKFSELCRRHGVSRKTGYKWVNRYEELGIEGLHDQSRKPYYSPRQAPYHIRKEIIGIREKHSS